MTDARACPTRQELADFVVGRTTEDRARDVETHLTGCHSCITALSAISQPDPLVDAVRAGAGCGDDPADRSLLDRLRQLPPPPDSAGLSTDSNVSAITGTLDGDRAGDDKTEPQYDFLTPPQEPGELGRLGPYRVLGVLGRGGMGVVFRAEDPRLGRPVALKAMLPRAAAVAESAAARFMAEARAAAQLKHDHVVTIYHVEEDRGIPFIVMELLEGESLEDRLRRAGKMTPAEVLQVGQETAAALAAAHSRGLVHRDIKPGNLWLEAPSGRVKVLDFGLARATAGDANLTSSGVIVGTPAYMPPEQARGQRVDSRADLFALGCVLYRACTGRQPFIGPDVMSVLLAVTTDHPLPPRTVCPDVPAGLSALVMKLLEKDPKRRPKSADEVVRALAALETTEPVRERERPRWPVLLGLLLVGLVAALAGWVIIRDKDGNEVARVKVPDGGTATVVPDAPKTEPLRTERPTPKFPSPLAIPEPPPLAEWLKGRTELTVSQDGKAQFKTIQAALDALKPGQVVKVLDRGPYRERLNLAALPTDAGLVSDAGTQIELTDWPENQQAGHFFGPGDRFRLSGFAFVGPDRRTWGALVNFHRLAALVAEDCYFGVTLRPERPTVCGLNSYAGGNDSIPRALTVRRCLFSGTTLHVPSPDAENRGTVLVEQNYFRTAQLLVDGRRVGTLVVRHNVLDAGGAPNIGILRLWQVDGAVEVSNNTLADRWSLKFRETAPQDRVTVRNNLSMLGPEFDPAPAEGPARDLTAGWQTSHNGFLRPGYLARGPSDVAADPAYLSTDPASRDYLRVPAGGPHATSGAGGAWPGYIGALPPGPAPKAGDWFTKLRDRWGDMPPAKP